MAQDRKQNQEAEAPEPGEKAPGSETPGRETSGRKAPERETPAGDSPIDTGDDPLVDLSNLAQTQEVSPDANPVGVLEAEVASLKDQLLRAMAETENVRRRAQREREDSVKYAAAPVVKDLLGVADNLQRALESVSAEQTDEDEHLKSLRLGVEMTQKELQAAFERHSIKPIEPLGERLDPHLHEAMFEVEDPSQPAGTVVQVIQAGYRLHDRLLRPARVGISKGGAKPASGGGANGDQANGGGTRPGDTVDTSA